MAESGGASDKPLLELVGRFLNGGGPENLDRAIELALETSTERAGTTLRFAADRAMQAIDRGAGTDLIERTATMLDRYLMLTPEGSGRYTDSAIDLARLRATLVQYQPSPDAIARAVDAGRLAARQLDDDPQLPMLLASLAWHLNQQQTPQSREEALSAWERALALSPTGSPFAPDIARDLSEAIEQQLPNAATIAQLTPAINAHRRCAEEFPLPNEVGVRATVWLAVALARRHELTSCDDDRDQSIEAWRELIPLIGRGRDQFQWNLGGLLLARFRRARDAGDLDDAIECLAAAAEDASLEALTRSERWAALSEVLHDRFELRSEIADLDASIDAARRAFDLPVPEEVKAARGMQATALLRMKARHTRARADADEAVSFLAGLESTSTDAHAADYANELRAALADRWEIEGRSGPDADRDLDDAIAAGRRSVPSAARDRAMRLYSVASLLRTRHYTRGSLDDVDEAIDRARACLAEEMDIRVRSGVLAFLADLLLRRYSIRGPRAFGDLAEGKKKIEDSVRLDPAGPGISDRLLTLVSFREELPRVAPVLQGEHNTLIEQLQEAIDRAPEGWSRMPEALERAALALARRSRREHRPSDLDEAIELAERALGTASDRRQSLTVSRTILADLLRSRYARGHARRDRDRARSLYRHASTEEHGDVVSALQASTAWAWWAFTRRAWKEAGEAFDIAIDASERLYRAQLARQSRELSLVGAAPLWTAGAYVQAKLEQLSEATERFERARARLISDVLEVDRADVEALADGDPALAGRYRAAASAWRGLVTEAPALRLGPTEIRLQFGSGDIESLLAGQEDDERQVADAPPPPLSESSETQAEADQSTGDGSVVLADAREVMDAVIAEIRQRPGHENFLAPVAREQINLAAEGAPLVYLLPTANGGLALIAGPTGQRHPVWLPQLNSRALADKVRSYRDTYESSGDDGGSEDLIHTVDELTRWLWKAAMGPVVEHLDSVGEHEAVLIPGGMLGILPLTAAWAKSSGSPSGRVYALDRALFTTVPNALALLACRALAAERTNQQLVAVKAPHVANAPELPFASLEVDAVSATFADPQILEDETASPDRLLDDWSDADIVHLSCHAAASIWAPLESRLALPGGDLTLRAILGRRTRTQLSVLSACETAVPGAELPDEMVGFPAGLVQAGTGGVVASLWSVRDRSTAMLMFRFYDAWRVEFVRPPAALRAAQQWLRDTSNREKLDYLGARLPESGHPMAESAQTLWRELALDPDLDLDAYDHQSPYHWAGFQHTGA